MEQQNLWAPWRLAYMQGLDQPPAKAATNPAKPPGCFLCEAIGADSPDTRAQHHVLVNDARGVLMLNRYPYANGHLLAVPHTHAVDLAGLDRQGRHGLMDLLTLGEALLRQTVHAQGVNIGMNLGRCAGAGVPGHLHAHVVPRWHGDTNFMGIVAGVRVIPEALDQTYRVLREALEEMGE